MLDHISVTVSDMARATAFWDAVMAALGQPCVGRSDDWAGYGLRADADHPQRCYMSLFLAAGGVTADRRHWCFKAPSRAAVDASHPAGVAHGGRCDGPPGLRPHYHPGYYAAFLCDPDGNRIEAVWHGG
ncbi:VOC family protein [Caenispirillum bisanense]|uniref:VOC family protein n=1 Tax=Caenispirillum bisanense TaxID=414052 RepID=UPI0031DBCE68